MRHDLKRAGITLAVLAGALIGGSAAPTRAVDLDRKPVLRSIISVRSNLVTVADFFEGAGTSGSTAIFRAPDLGKTGTVTAEKVVQAARAAGLFDAQAGSVVNVTVTHEARHITQDDIGQLIATAAIKEAQLPEGTDLQVTFDQPIETHDADVNSGNPMHLGALTYSPITSRFDAIVILDMGDSAERLRLRGTATEMVQTVSLTRPINRGEVIAADDLHVEKLPRKSAGNTPPIEPSQIIGLAAKRQLRPDNPIAFADFAPPQLVARGDTVTLVFELPGIMLTARGTAQDNGAKGDAVTVLNPTSKRIVHGTVIGQGKVQVVGGILTANADDDASNAARTGRQTQ